MQGLDMNNSSAVDDDVQATKSIDGLLNRSAHTFFLRYIALQENCFVLFGGKRIGVFLSSRVQVDKCNAGAFGCEETCDCLSHSR